MGNEDSNVEENAAEWIRVGETNKTFGKRTQEARLDDGKDTKRCQVDPNGKERPFVCAWEGCGKQYKRAMTLNIHITSSHTNNERVACPWPSCSRDYKSRALLVRHYRRVHHVRLPVVCEECEKDLIDQESLDRHIDLNHQKPYKCSWDGCKKSYKTPSERVLHQKFHEETCIACPWKGCIKTCRRACDLSRHISERHTHICTVEDCALSFTSSEQLARHVAWHNDPTPKAEDKLAFLKCDFSYCARSFPTVESLKKHQRKLHVGEEPFVCSYCGRKYPTEILICSHLSKNWKICGVEYDDCIPSSTTMERNPKNLEKSDQDCVATDNGETVAKVFSCTFTLCTKTFPSSLGLSYHSVIHAGERPFVCSECSNSYRHEESLRYHLNQSQQKCGTSYSSDMVLDESEDGTCNSPCSAASDETDFIKVECYSPAH